MAKKWMKGAAIAAVVLLLAAVTGKAYQARQARQSQAAEAAAALRIPTVFELAPDDVVQARTRTLVESVAISGALRAATSAVIKAKVAGELNGLQVREGDSVRTGQVLARIDPTEYQARTQQAHQQAQAAAAQVAIAQRQLDNNQALVSKGFISKTALDTSLSSLESAQANHRAALAALDIAQKSLSDTALRSPLNGQIAARLVQNGERVGVDARVLELVDLSSLEMEAAVPPAAAALLVVGQSAQLTVEGLPQAVQARVVRISPTAQANSRSILVYLKLQATLGLRHGLFAQGHVWLGERTAVALPMSSVRNDKPQTYVQMVQTADGGLSHIAHVPVKVLGQGVDKQEAGHPPPSGLTPYAITDSIADKSILLSGRAGFMQENTTVRLTQTSLRQP